MSQCSFGVCACASAKGLKRHDFPPQFPEFQLIVECTKKLQFQIAKEMAYKTKLEAELKISQGVSDNAFRLAF